MKLLKLLNLLKLMKFAIFNHAIETNFFIFLPTTFLFDVILFFSMQVLKFVLECLYVDLPDHVVLDCDKYKYLRNLLLSLPGINNNKVIGVVLLFTWVIGVVLLLCRQHVILYTFHHIRCIYLLYYINQISHQWRNDRPCYPRYAGGGTLRGRHNTEFTVF